MVIASSYGETIDTCKIPGSGDVVRKNQIKHCIKRSKAPWLSWEWYFQTSSNAFSSKINVVNQSQSQGLTKSKFLKLKSLS